MQHRHLLLRMVVIYGNTLRL